MKTNYLVLLALLFAGLLPGVASAQGVNIESGVRVVASGNVSLVISNGSLKNDGIFTPANSTVFFDGGAGTAITGTQPITFYNATFRGSGSKVNAGNAALIGTLAVEGSTVLDADGTANDKAFTLLSSDTATARVDVLTTGNITGNVTVERYIHTGTTAAEHLKSWQFLATPTAGQTIFQSWQEGGLAPAGYGTWITGTGSGFDAATQLPSLKFYDAPTSTWTGVTNTSGLLQNKLGYMLFVRGDRTVTTFNGTPNRTNMRSKGVLFTPANPPATVVVPANKFQAFGNPYASRISFNSVYLASTGINNVFHVWDPRLNGSYGVGGYQTLSGVTGYVPTAGSPTTYYPAGVPSPYIESGQAVIVDGNATGGIVNFNENCKVSGSRLVNRGPVGSGNLFPDRQFLFTSLFTNTGMIADGNIVAFENGLGNEVNKDDADKIFNAGENFGLSRNGSVLAVEARDLVVADDTVFYHMLTLRQQAYELRFAPVNMSPGLTAYLVDRFDGSSTPISLTDSSFVNFTVTASPGSNAANRFILVFKQTAVVPVKIIGIAAVRNSDQSIGISWNVENELDLQKYFIERSADGAGFSVIGNTLPVANNGGSASYRHRDALPLSGVNFYRIKAVSISGQAQYSAIVKVHPLHHPSSITIHPNPIQDNAINIGFSNQPNGNYSVQLTNELGQLIYKTTLAIDQVNVVQTIRPGTLAAGTYQLSLVNDEGSKVVKQVVVK